MSKHIDDGTWDVRSTDIAYKDPYSSTTRKIRTQLTFWSSIALLNHFYPIDLNTSHVLGLKFSEGVIPPLNGLLGIIVLYLIVVLTIYVTQEIMSWLAQANEVKIREHRSKLDDIYAHHGNIHTAVSGATNQLENHQNAVLNLNKILKEGTIISKEELQPNINTVEVHKQSFENFCMNLGDSNKKFEEEIYKAKSILNTVSAQYRTALTSQLIKVVGLEIFLPFTLGILSVFYTAENVLALFE